MSDERFDEIPVLPEGVEALTLHHIPEGWDPPPADCFVCGETIPKGSMTWGIPGRGIAHEDCYDPRGDG